MSYESTILILFVVASLVAVAARRVNLPYTIALVAVGLLLGGLHLLHPPHLTQELLYSVFLPPLIFEAALHLRPEDLRRDAAPITVLVIPGVALSILLTAAVMIPASETFTQVHNFTWPIAILFGAAVAATDPIAVVSLFRRLGAPRRLRLLVESESLLNDGTSIVAFTLAMAYYEGALTTIESASMEFVRVVGLGILVGGIVGLLLDAVIRRIDDAMIVITLSTVAAYGSFLLADWMGVSGVMSTVASGLILGSSSLRNSSFPTIQLSMKNFWEYLSFAMNSLIFLLIGFNVDPMMLWELWPLVLVAYVSVLVARIGVVAFTWGLFYPTSYRFPPSWAVVLGWGGLRGALSMVLALSLPDSLSMKQVLVTLVFGVVLLSIFVQGLSMSPILRWLNIVSPISELREYELLKTRLSLYEETLETLERLHAKRYLSSESLEEFKKEYQERIDQLSKELDQFHPRKEALVQEERLRIERRMIMEEKRSLLERYESGIISLEVYRSLQREFDAKLFELENLGA